MADNKVDQTEEKEEDHVAESHNNRLKRLTTVSRFYDIDGDGQLDEAEQAMRDMDQSRRGHLTNEQVYQMMVQHMKTQKELFKFKKVVIG